MPEQRVQFPVQLEPGQQLRVPSIKNLGIDFILVVVEPASFNTLDELFECCQDPDQITFQVLTVRKPS